MRLQVFLTGFLVRAVATNLTISPVVTTPLCYAANVADPLVAGSVGAPVAEIRRVAWPLSSPPLNVPLSINGEEPVGSPEVICMTGCVIPPCLPLHSCAPGDLWWSAQYARGAVVVAEGDLLRLPDTLTPPPPVMAFLWETFVPLPSVSPTPSPSPVPSPCPSFAAVAAPCVCGQPPTAIAAYVFLGILGLVVAVLLYCVGMLYSYTTCPYCGATFRCGEAHLTHLKACESHLKLFTPLTQVETIVAAAPVIASQQVVFAERRKLVNPIKEAELVPLGAKESERAESEEVTVILTPPNLVLEETPSNSNAHQ